MFITRYMFIYIGLLILLMIFSSLVRHLLIAFINRRRKKRKLTSEVFVGPEIKLRSFRKTAWIQPLFIIICAISLPFLNLYLFDINEKEFLGLITSFTVLFFWFLSTTGVLKSLIGGMAFRIIVLIKPPPFQLYDRVTLKGYSGKVLEIGLFYVRIQTLDEDIVSIPTYSLLSEVIVSSNAGERSSLCVIEFFLSPGTSPKNRKKAEDIIWDAVQSSFYYDPEKPLQIYCSQRHDAIVLSAKASVANTYRELDFKSEVTNKVLDAFRTDGNNIMLSYSLVKEPINKIYY